MLDDLRGDILNDVVCVLASLSVWLAYFYV